ncbi:tail-collar fiber protein [Pseudomonas sp. SJZ085]|uniref:phage tail protein n=1 Tax=unclassified Pseudomonas TaxID=196821 RepID=UPI00119A9443|nr:MULTISPECIES: phage tail protein [unclassified Pseudomonas]TWC15718.1 tail-collar fiber protein [Pseudomonas sp. SJZ074]TWC33994.1 tail-collar fiber protein [Pseudomonas sp. SJZ085]
MTDQNSQFFAILTAIGKAKQANADALGIPWTFAQMGVGDANDTDPIPDEQQTHLINERRRAPLNQLSVDPANPNIIVAEQVIPENIGGWWIREVGLYDADGDLVAVANCAPSFKPLLTQGSGRTQVVRMNLIVSNTANVELKIDPSVVLATRTYVDSKIREEMYKLDNKQSVRVATTGNIALTGLQVVDGVTLLAGDRVLVKNQTTAKDNGLYITATAAWQRAPDADTSVEVTSALQVSVEQGATQADTRWQLVTDGVIVLGTTALTFQDVTKGFAPLNSPALINPTANTPAQFDSTSKIATTEFVKKNSGNHAAIGGLSANTTLTSANTFGMSYMLNSATPFTVTLPLASTSPNGGVVTFTNVLTAPVTLALQGADYMTGIDGVGAGGSIVLRQRDTITLSCAGTNVWYAEGGSVRDSQSSAIRSLMGNYSGIKILSMASELTAADTGVVCIGSSALAGSDVTLPQLSTTASGQTIAISAGAGAFNLKPFSGDPKISIGLSVLSLLPIDVFESIVLVSNPTGWRVISGTVLNKYSGTFSASLSSNGYHKLPSGVIIQWGTAGTSNGFGTWTYPIAFPNSVFRVFASNDASASGAAMYACGAHPNTASPNVSATIASQLATGGDAIYLLAIGY